MAEHGEWLRKGATLTNLTAPKEYGVSHEFIVEGVRAGKLEYRQASMWGNPCYRLLRSQVENYIEQRLGTAHLRGEKANAELRRIKREISSLKRKLAALQMRKDELEKAGTK